VLVVLPVGPHDVCHLEIANREVITAQEGRLVSLELLGHLLYDSVGGTHVSGLCLWLSIVALRRTSELAPLLEQETESSIDIPGPLRILRVDTDLLLQVSLKSVGLIALKPELSPDGNHTIRE